MVEVPVCVVAAVPSHPVCQVRVLDRHNSTPCSKAPEALTISTAPIKLALHDSTCILRASRTACKTPFQRSQVPYSSETMSDSVLPQMDMHKVCSCRIRMHTEQQCPCTLALVLCINVRQGVLQGSTSHSPAPHLGKQMMHVQLGVLSMTMTWLTCVNIAILHLQPALPNLTTEHQKIIPHGCSSLPVPCKPLKKHLCRLYNLLQRSVQGLPFSYRLGLGSIRVHQSIYEAILPTFIGDSGHRQDISSAGPTSPL